MLTPLSVLWPTTTYRRWIEFHNILHPRLDVPDEVAVEEMRRCPVVRSQGEPQRARDAGSYEKRVTDARWR